MTNANTFRELKSDLLTKPTRAKGAMHMNELIEQICARQKLERLVSLPARMPAPPSPQRAGQSGLNADAAPFRKRIDSYDEKDDAFERPEWPLSMRIRLDESYLNNSEGEEQEPARQRKAPRRVQRNIFIDAETYVDWDASAQDEDDDNENNDLNKFIVADDVEYYFF